MAYFIQFHYSTKHLKIEYRFWWILAVGWNCSCRVYYSEYPIIFKSKKKLPHKYSEY